MQNAENKDRTGAFWLQNLNLSFFDGEKKTAIMKMRVCVYKASCEASLYTYASQHTYTHAYMPHTGSFICDMHMHLHVCV